MSDRADGINEMEYLVTTDPDRMLEYVKGYIERRSIEGEKREFLVIMAPTDGYIGDTEKGHQWVGYIRKGSRHYVNLVRLTETGGFQEDGRLQIMCLLLRARLREKDI